MKVLSILFIASLTVLLFACEGGNGNSGNNTELNIVWIEDSGAPIITAQFEDGILTGYLCYNYLEVNEGSGEIEISANLESSSGESKGSKNTTFQVEEGQLYKLTIEVNCSGPSDYDPDNPPIGFPNEFTISSDSPSAITSIENIVTGGFYTNTLSLGQVFLDLWENIQPMRSLEAKVLPEGSGSISDNFGLLVYEGTRPGRAGEFYVGEYEHGTEITLTATPASGYVFDYWYGTLWTNKPVGPSVTFKIQVPIYIQSNFTEE
ncbi:MAG: hypothetical protein JRI61_03735 [Deltaproteobacteria bacterium]|nr:hypothetical protein [Deltaproteobacteria bacterium]